MKIVLYAILIAMVGYPLCKLARKMGHNPLVGLLVLIPGLNIVMLYLAASTKWPIEYEFDALLEENRKLKQKET